MAFSYTRLYERDGVSHFEEVLADGDGAGRFEPLAVTALIPFELTAPPEPSAHNAPRRQFIIHLAGSVAVDASGGDSRVFEPGSVVFAEDLEGAGHVTTWVGDGPWRWLVLPAA